jgi:tetratricopeptide (TPR) repeat protein
MIQLEAKNNVQDIYCKGLSCLKDRDYVAALGYFNQALNLEPNNVNIWDKQSITLRELGRYYEADVSKSKVHKLYYDQKLLSLSEDDLPINDSSSYEDNSELTCTIDQASYWVEVANRAYYNFDFASEADAYMRALEIQPDNYKNWYSLGIALRHLKSSEMAINAYQNALEIAPNFHLAWNGLGNALRDIREYSQALTAYHKAIALAPDFHHAWHGMGNTLRARQEYVAAIEAYEKAIRIAPRYHLSWYGLGNAFRDLGCHQQALFAYETVIKIAPSFWRAWDAKGVVLASLEDDYEAIDTWQLGIDTLETHLPLNHEGCGELYSRLGAYQYAQGKNESYALPYYLAAKDSYGRALYHLERANLTDRYQELLAEYDRLKKICQGAKQNRSKAF